MNHNETIIKIKKRTNPYTMIDSSIFLDNRLSWKAKGLMGYFLSRPEDWKINLKDLYKQSTDGYDSVKSGLKDLKEHGYLELKAVRHKGKIVAWEYIVYEVPMEVNPEDVENSPREGFPPVADSLEKPQEGFPLVEKPPMEKPLEGKPLEENPPHTNIDSNNINTTYIDFTKDLNDGYAKDKLKYAHVINQCQLELFEDNITGSIEEAIKSLFFDAEYALDTLKMPLEVVRDSLEKLNPYILEYAVFKMKKAAASGSVIHSSKHYLMSCILNAITEYVSDSFTDPADLKNPVYKPKKTIFDIAKGTEFEEPVNVLKKVFSEITFNAFLKESIESIQKDGNTLFIHVNDEFIGQTLTEKYRSKIKDCFKGIGVKHIEFDYPLKPMNPVYAVK